MTNQILSLKSKIVLVLSTIIGLLIVIAITWYRIQLLSPASKQSQSIEFEIEEGTPTKQIAQNLDQKGVIKSKIAFLIYIKTKNLVLQSGFYMLDPSITSAAIAEIIGKGKVSEYKVTIPEGWRLEQIAQLLHKKGIVQYESFVNAARGKEGKLFPDTYKIGPKTSADEIVAKMARNFERRLKEVAIPQLRDEDLILASIIEREAKRDEDRPKMAGVYKNRLKINMVLEADPTTQYAVDSENISQLSIKDSTSYEFWKPITAQQNKNFESPYNTYRNRGLPLDPIANPGIKSIKAAVKPEKHSFYFFFNLPDGTTIYSKTREEHDANRQKHGV